MLIRLAPTGTNHLSINLGQVHTDDFESADIHDISLRTFLSALSDSERHNLTPTRLKAKKVYGFSDQSHHPKYLWKVYNCLYTEISGRVDGATFILNNGKWFKVKNDYAEEINEEFASFRDSSGSVSLSPCSGLNEAQYNSAQAAADPAFFCMDANNIFHGGGSSQIEFCDLFSADKKLIHVKKYQGSSVLSISSTKVRFRQSFFSWMRNSGGRLPINYPIHIRAWFPSVKCPTPPNFRLSME